MPYDRFLIGPQGLNTGLQTDLKPFLIADDAFSQLTNAYVFRGRTRKRFGGLLMGNSTSTFTAPLLSRLRIDLGPTVMGALSGTVPGSLPWTIGVAFSIGSEIYTVVNPAGGPQVMLDTGITTTKTFDLSTGNFVFAGAPAGEVYFYPALPVMGLTVYELGPINNQPSFAFDTQFAYTFTTGSWTRSGTGTTPQWNGTDLNFFWTTNWQGTTTSQTSPPVLFVTNFNATIGAPGATDDPIWYFDGTTWTAATGANAFYFRPNGGAPQTGPYVKTSRLIVVFKNTLILLNTVENDNSGGAGVNTAYVNRARFSVYGSPFVPNAWYELGQSDNTGIAETGVAFGGGYVDAPTEEQIISAEFLKDRLIVFFQRSTWELAYTGNFVQPFVWQKINTELGAEAEQSSVPFDQVILTMGNTGVHACNGSNVQRIDNKIPDQVFEIKDKALGVQRVAGVRDYFVEMVYWTFPSDDENPVEKFPNQVLVYNYKNDSWALNDDCITAFGYFEQQSDLTWQDALMTWEDATFSWNSGVTQAQFRQVLAGNQQGYVFIVAPDISRNAPVMQLTNATGPGPVLTLTIIDHTLSDNLYNDYILIENAQGTTGLGGIYKVQTVVDKDTIAIQGSFTGTYVGGGQITRVSNIQILTKQWNFYSQKGRNVYINKIDFLIDKTGDFTNGGGQITIDYYPSFTELSMLQAGQATGSILGTGVLETTPYNPALYPLEEQQDQLWHPIYLQASGEAIQLFMYMSDAQMTTSVIALADFQMHALVVQAMATSARLQ